MITSATTMASQGTRSSAGPSGSRRQARSRWKGFPLWLPTCSPPGGRHPAAGSARRAATRFPCARRKPLSRGRVQPLLASRARPAAPPWAPALSCAAELDADQRGSAVDAMPCSAVRDPRTRGGLERDWCRATEGPAGRRSRHRTGEEEVGARVLIGPGCTRGCGCAVCIQFASDLHPVVWLSFRSVICQLSGILSGELSWAAGSR